MLTMESKEFTVRGGVECSRFDGWCLSSDLKPTAGVLNGSCLVEMDTGKVYFFDEAGARWREFAGDAGETGQTEGTGETEGS